MPSLAIADERLPAPQGPVLLAVSGTIARTTDGRQALFDRAMLEALGVVKLAAASPLDMQPVEFEGVLLRRLLEAVGAKGEAIEAIALNDYVAEIPVAEAKMHDIVIAFRRQGRDIPVREMGPLMILYPTAREPALDTEAVQARSVRQLARLVIRAATKLGLAQAAEGQPVQEPVPAASGKSPLP
ncbi:MAG: molybdopterin-dependent oxidoreductase [Pseudomonadota bacterium]